MRSRSAILFAMLAALTLFLFLLDLAVGAVAVPLGDVWAALTGGDCPRATAKIILNIRLIKAVVALLAGAALSVSGLQMQTLFRNPLAGPYVLGISSGASLGVALVVLAGFGSSIGIAGAAWLGAALVLVVIAAVGRIENCVLILLVFYDIQKLKTDRISVLIGKDNKIGIHNCNILLGVLFAAQKHANLKLLYLSLIHISEPTRH